MKYHEENETCKAVQGKKQRQPLNRFKCAECPKEYSLKDSLQRHVKYVHRGEATYECETCHTFFRHETALSQHIRRVHDDSFGFVCKYCGKTFKMKGGLNVHIQNVHENCSDRPFKCDTCEKSFKRKGGLLDHIETIHEDKRIECGVCSKPIRKRSLKQHMDTHATTEGRKKFECKFCGTQFARNSGLVAHTNRFHIMEAAVDETAENPFQCQLCKKRFSKEQGLKFHQKFTHEKVE